MDDFERAALFPVFKYSFLSSQVQNCTLPKKVCLQKTASCDKYTFILQCKHA